MTRTVTRTLAAVGLAGCARPEASNVLLVVLDDLGQDKVSSYGVHPDAPATPTLDALAAAGVRFTQAWAYPTCSPSRAALLTGQHPRRHGIGVRLTPNEDPWELHVGAQTLPTVLDAEGWDHALVGKWHLSAGTLGEDPRHHPALHGFAWHEGPLANLYATLTDEVPRDERGDNAWEEIRNGAVAWKHGYATSEAVDDAVARARAMHEPWLLWLALPSVHDPLERPPPHLDPQSARTPPDTDVGTVDAMVRAVDAELGRLLEGLGPLRERTTVIVLGDNGTAEHAIAPPLDPARGKGSVFEGGVRVPLIVAGPAVGAPGTVSDALVSVVDVLPTVAELAGADLSGRVLDGTSFAGALADPDAPVHERVFAETFAPLGPGPYTSGIAAIRDAERKLIRDHLGRTWLYDVSDPEVTDEGEDLLAAGPLSADDEAAFAALEAALDAQLATLSAE